MIIRRSETIVLSLSLLLFMVANAAPSDFQYLAQDDFERPAIGINWSLVGNVDIIGNSDIGFSTQSPIGLATWNNGLFPADQFSEAEVSGDIDQYMVYGVYARRRASDGARYQVHYNPDVAPPRWEIKYDGVPSSLTRILATNYSHPASAPGDRLRIEVISSEIRGFHNDKQILYATDDNITSGQPGMAYRFGIGAPETYPSRVYESWTGGFNGPKPVLAHYKFDEGAGVTASDSSGNGNAGSVSGAAWTAGKSGSALSFDGLNDYVAIADTGGFDNIQQLTISAWVNLDAVNKNRGLVSKTVNSFTLMNGGITNSWQFMAGSSASCNIEVPNSATAGGWHMITATFTGGAECRLYLDGNQIGFDITGVSATIPDSSFPVLIGAYSVNAGFTDGTVDDVRIYNRALSATEIASLYAGGRQ